MRFKVKNVSFAKSAVATFKAQNALPMVTSPLISLSTQTTAPAAILALQKKAKQWQKTWEREKGGNIG